MITALGVICQPNAVTKTGLFSFTNSLHISGYVFLCRSELCSRSWKETLALINENQSQNRKLNSLGHKKRGGFTTPVEILMDFGF